MPIYSYVHTNKSKCDFKETLQSLNEPKLTECPKCKKEIKFILSNTANPLFIGPGFYETDYKRKGK
jgi:putative FmdB family regulatory protein